MSLVSTWVQSQEGSWWRNPVIRGADFFLCWDDDDPPELVYRRDVDCSLEEIVATLRKMDFRVEPIRGSRSCGARVFGHLWEFRPARRAFLRILSAPPERLLEKTGAERSETEPKGQGVFFPRPGREGERS